MPFPDAAAVSHILASLGRGLNPRRSDRHIPTAVPAVTGALLAWQPGHEGTAGPRTGKSLG